MCFLCYFSALRRLFKQLIRQNDRQFYDYLFGYVYANHPIGFSSIYCRPYTVRERKGCSILYVMGGAGYSPSDPPISPHRYFFEKMA